MIDLNILIIFIILSYILLIGYINIIKNYVNNVFKNITYKFINE